MSLLPFVFGCDPWERHINRYHNWDHFGLGVRPDDILSIVDFPDLKIHPRYRSHRTAGDLKPTTIGKDGFQACIDVGQFKPNEITVKTVDDNHVVVEGKHEEREDEHGYISRQFVRKYVLPKGYNAKDLTSTLSSDGVLTIKAPPPQNQKSKSNERIVQIQQTGPAHMNVKENPAMEGGDKQNKK